MSSRSPSRPKKSASLTKKRSRIKTARRPAPQSLGWVAWWPLLAGLALTIGAVETAEILPLMGPGGVLKLKLLYPFALLLKQPQLGLSEQAGNTWSQIMLYAQWLLYGLFASLAVHWTSRWRALVQIVAFHFAGFCALWVLSTK